MRRSFSNSSRTSSKLPLFPALAAALALAACGGSGNPGPAPGPGPAPPGGGTPEAACSAASLAPFDNAPDAFATAPLQEPSPALLARKRSSTDGNPRGRLLDALWLHRSREGRIRRPLAATTGRDAVDIGDIAVIQDEGDLIEPANVYDLRNVGLRFTPNGAGGYDASRIDAAFRTTVGDRVTLTDDDSVQVNVPFAFSFYGRSQTAAFVNSDGNVTFERGDNASTERNVARLLTGPPRLAPFLADLDPSTGGRVLAHAAADQYTVTWCGVRGFDSSLTANVQLTLLPGGAIEMKFGAVSLPGAIVGLSPGGTDDFRPVDLSAVGVIAGGSGAIGERFADTPQLDTVEVARKFYRSHPDQFDQLVYWTDQPLVTGSFAFESTVANEIRGIGLEVFDQSSAFGSAGRLRSFAMMDALGKYPDHPLQRFLGENSTVSVLGQEVGHRWLAFFDFRDHTGVRSGALLGRDEAHWSFFMDSDASVMEGNDIEDLGGGAFRTAGAVQRYSLLDQYAMGLVAEHEVPPFFYVANPVNVAGNRDASSAPAAGVTFNGTRRDVLIQDIVAIHGPRIPAAADSPRVHRQAFIFVVGAGRSPSEAQVAKVDRIRQAWEPFFSAATSGRMQAVTSLR